MTELKNKKKPTEQMKVERGHADEVAELKKKIVKMEQKQSELVMVVSRHMIDIRELWAEVVKLRSICDMGISDAKAEGDSKVDPAELTLYGDD